MNFMKLTLCCIKQSLVFKSHIKVQKNLFIVLQCKSSFF